MSEIWIDGSVILYHSFCMAEMLILSFDVFFEIEDMSDVKADDFVRFFLFFFVFLVFLYVFCSSSTKEGWFE